MALSAAVCAFFFEPVYDADGPPVPTSPTPPASPSAPKKRGRKKQNSLGGANRHRCKVCHNIYTQAASTGYTNLLTHLRLKHPEWEEMFKGQRLEEVAVASAPTSVEIAEPPFRSSAATSSASKLKQNAGRKRGPVYEHFEDIPSSPGNKQKKMRCNYCHQDTPQLSGRLKLHLSTKCVEAPDEVKSKYAGAVGLLSNRLENVKSEKVKSEIAKEVETKAPVEISPAKVSTISKKSPVKPSPPVVYPKQKDDGGDFDVYEEKLTTALITANAPWNLLDNANFQDAMRILQPAMINFPLTASRARTEVLDRLVQKYDSDCKDVLATANALTLMINHTDGGPDGVKKVTYVAVDEWRRAFVLAERDLLTSPNAEEVLSVVSSLSSNAIAKLFLCCPTSGAYGRSRRELKQGTSAGVKTITLTGVCMTQQTALLLHELVLCSMSLEEALENAVLTADALRESSSLRQRVLQAVYSNTSATGDANAFVQVSLASLRSVAMAVKQATRLEPYLRLAISEESQNSTSAIVRQLADVSGTDMAWSTLRHTAQILAPLNFIAALSELKTSTSGQFLALWIWLFGTATRSPLLDGNSEALVTSFMQRLECYVEEHFVACLVLDPRVHGAGLSVSGLRRARAVTIRVGTELVPGFNENNFIRSYNDFMKHQGDFGEPGVWSAANTSSPMEFWGDYEGDPVHNQLAVVAKIVCSFVPHTSSLEELWLTRAQRTKTPIIEESKQHEKCTKIRHGAALSTQATAKDVVSKFHTLLDVESEPSVEEMLQSNGVQDPDVPDTSTPNLSIRSVLESVQDGMEQDVAESDAPSTSLDASWFDISSAGLDKIRSSMERYLSAAIQQ
ncbi:hypothetical protein P3T76_005369 [Phytophthora citrophthora]|uniref:BED-type domain-containing protein n=1 Tax=Phytophthora citrophthora TaxID=4793 RepID=A0AAD9LNK2_9STRA|nr:hypothetical protein P3T76_005369 [Phytophthora citrophthora]